MDDWEWLFLYVFAGLIGLQLLHHLFFYTRLAFYKKKEVQDAPNQAVSIIVCARNESENLKELIPLLLEQDYFEFEVIIVDDQSEDETVEYLYPLAQQVEKLKYVKVGDVKKPMAGKKFPLTLGLKAAKYDIVLLTDADCRPISNQWLKNMASGYTDKKSIVLGFSPYLDMPGWLNLNVRYETFYAGLNYLSYALAGLPYMGVGRNLSYAKSHFFTSGGFTEHRTLLSGDDDLFINKVSNGKNTTIEISSDSQMISTPVNSFSEWVEQKKRHLSTARYYKFKHRFLLALNPALQILIYLLLAPVLYFSPIAWYFVVAAFVFRLIVIRVLFTLCMIKLSQRKLIPYIELFDILQVLYYFRFLRATLVKTNYRWN